MTISRTVVAVATVIGIGGTTDVPHIGPGQDSSAHVTQAAASGEQPGNLRGGGPDRAPDVVGGVAARLRTVDDRTVTGHLFLLMGAAGSSRTARVYDDTPYPRTPSPLPVETTASNVTAHHIATTIVGRSTPAQTFVAAPGGGHSGGLVYALGYVNELTAGSLTGDITIAATGALQPWGYLRPIEAIDEKTAAAASAGVEVLFTAIAPTDAAVAAHGRRLAGFGPRPGDADIAEERGWDRYRAWGADRPDDGMDIVVVRHLGDVFAYLCGAESRTACQLVDELTRVDLATLTPATGS